MTVGHLGAIPLNMWLFCLIQIENKELRDLLVISKSSVKTAREETNQPAADAAEEQSSQPDSDE